MNLTKITRHASSDVYVDSESGDEQYSINSKETSFDNIVKENNSKINSPFSHLEEPTSDLQSQYQTSSSSPSPPLPVVSTNLPNPNPISNLTNRLSNNSSEKFSKNPENVKFKKGQLVNFKFDKVSYTIEILGTAGTTTGQYKNHINVEYKVPLEYVNKQASVNFVKVDNLKSFDNTEEIFQVENECFQTAEQI